jgi:oxygen-independent coproporphyrinogen-3 oxidase
MQLMCQGRLEFEAIERAHGLHMSEYFAKEFEHCARSRSESRGDRGRRGPGHGSRLYLVRAIAMVFDRHLQLAKETARISRVV